MPKIKTLNDIKTLDDYDFLDLGAGDGRSIDSSKNKIGGRGIGLELREAKVERAQQLGREVVLGDALKLSKVPGKVSYTVCDNFLEHLADKKAVKKMIQQAAAVTKNFIYIAHPSFEDIDYLKKFGLKTYWSDWHGHTAMLTVADMLDILHECGIHWVQVYPVYKIKTSDDPRIIPINAGIDQFHYDPKKHGKKPSPAIKFDRDMWYSFDIIGLMPGANKDLPYAEYHDRIKRQDHPHVYNWQTKSGLTALSKRFGSKVTRTIKK